MFPLLGLSQNRDLIVYDPTLNGTIMAQTSAEVATQRDIHEKEDQIKGLQTSIAGFQATLKDIEQKTFKYLSVASDVIVAARYIADMRTDILKTWEDLQECTRIVADEPYLLLVTVEVDGALTQRITELFEYVTNIAFVYDGEGSGSGTNQPKNLLNNAERMEIVYHVSNELKIIRGYTNYLKYHLQTAKKQSVFQNLCPYTYQVVRNCESAANNIINNFSL